MAARDTASVEAQPGIGSPVVAGEVTGAPGGDPGGGPSSSAMPGAERSNPATLRAMFGASPFPAAVVRGDELVLANRAFAALIGEAAADEAEWEVLAVQPAGQNGVTAPMAVGPPGPLFRQLADAARTQDGGFRLRRVGNQRIYQALVQPLLDGEALSVWLLERSEQARLESSLSAAEAWIHQHERLRATGELAMGIAHDIHNTLGAVTLRVSILKRDPSAMAAQGRNIEALERIVAEGNALVNKFQGLGRADLSVQPSAIDLREVIASAVEIAQSGLRMRARETGVHIHMETDLPPLPAVIGTSEELRQLFVNLLINARDAMRTGGRVLIRGEMAGDTVRISVEDEGTGIPPAILPRIFDSFFTTKGEGGTGMGLALARASMRRFGGSIDASNRPEGGASFVLTFPNHR
jgi:signal transduction histidine kinase